MVKDKHIISGINGFFHKNDCNKAKDSITTTIRHLNLRSSYIGIEERPNCKLTCLLILFNPLNKNTSFLANPLNKMYLCGDFL